MPQINEAIENLQVGLSRIEGKASQLAKDFIKQCLTKRAADRPSAEDLLNHPWLSERFVRDTSAQLGSKN